MFNKIAVWLKSRRLERARRKAALAATWEEIAQTAKQAFEQWHTLIDGSRYFDRVMATEWNEKFTPLCGKIAKTKKYRRLSHKAEGYIRWFKTVYPAQNKWRQHHNRAYIALEKNAYRSLFDSIEGHSLDDQQRESIVKDEINNLVIAGAGSGKTTAIVGKVKYLLAKGLYRPQELLVLSFTNASATEMAQRIRAETDTPLDVMTFHKLGKEIIARVEGKQPSVTEIDTIRFVEKQFSQLVKQPGNQGNLTRFFLSYYKQFHSPFEYRNKEDYQDYLRENQVVTLKGEAVKSFAEMEIANFLFCNQVKYAYEKSYEFDVATRQHGQYKPDFYLPEYRIYLEHFGIDREGKVPSFFRGSGSLSPAAAYQASMDWKRRLHREKGTTLVETYSFEMSEGTLLPLLTEKLQKLGVSLNPASQEELWNHLVRRTPLNLGSFSALIAAFINHMKANAYTLADVRAINNARFSGYNRLRNEQFLNLIEPIYLSYEDRLKEDREIDFNDMINRATDYVSRDIIVLDYKYIIVDEFQDMSAPRSRLITALKKKNAARLFCVGDDWQSIYRFAGSDLGFFTDFEKHFGYTERSLIETTYRFPREIIELSSKFILKNPGQVRKQLTSVGNSTRKAFSIIYRKTSLAKTLRAELEKLPQNSTVLLLGRYNADIEKFLDSRLQKRHDHLLKITRITCLPRKDLDIRFLTVHGAKGLQAEYVFILNNEKGRFGFPSNIADDPVLNLVLQKEETFPYAEERRLFYVALTRAKKHTYLLVDKGKRSIFVRELEKDFRQRDKPIPPGRCPKCGGRLLRRRGKYGPFYGCSNYPRCNYTKSMKGK